MESQSRSTFVTVLAWIFIALSAFGKLPSSASSYGT